MTNKAAGLTGMTDYAGALDSEKTFEIKIENKKKPDKKENPPTDDPTGGVVVNNVTTIEIMDAEVPLSGNMVMNQGDCLN